MSHEKPKAFQLFCLLECFIMRIVKKCVENTKSQTYVTERILWRYRK